MTSTMKKSGDLPISEKHATPPRGRSPRRRMCGVDDVIFYIVLLLIAFVIWSSEIRALFSTPKKHSCGMHMTVEERAVKILEENPLIG